MPPAALLGRPSYARVGTLAGWVAFAAPFCVYLSLVWRHAPDFPFSDDYDAVLRSALEVEDATSPAGVIECLFRPHNEHRIVFNRVVVLGQLRATGRINFRELQLFGALGWCGAALVFSLAVRRQLHLTIWQALPLPLILLAPVASWGLIFTTPAIQYSWCAFWSVLALVCLWRGRDAPSVLFTTLAILTSGAGVVLLPVGVVGALCARRRRSALLLGAYSAVALALLLAGYRRPPHHPPLSESLADPLRLGEYCLCVVGNFYNTDFAALSRAAVAIALVGLASAFVRFRKVIPVWGGVALAASASLVLLTVFADGILLPGLDLPPSAGGTVRSLKTPLLGAAVVSASLYSLARTRRSWEFAALAALYALGAIVLNGIGRSPLGVDHALAPYYAMFSVFALAASVAAVLSAHPAIAARCWLPLALLAAGYFASAVGRADATMAVFSASRARAKAAWAAGDPKLMRRDAPNGGLEVLNLAAARGIYR